MSDRTERQAAEAVRSRLQRVVSCVSEAVVIRGPEPEPPRIWTLGERHVPLRGRHRLELSLLSHHAIVGSADPNSDWRAVETAYFYQFRERSGPEVILFHRHPFPGLVDFPHLHLAGGAGSVAIDAGCHIPTGYVSLAAVVRFAIDELCVRPLRQDWARILDTADPGPSGAGSD